jgi:hypothetical protein
MSAPGCTVVFQRLLTEEEVRCFPSWLAPFGKVSPEWKEDCLDIVGNPKDFGCDLEDAEAELGLCLTGPEHAFDMSLEPATLGTLGWRPTQIVNVSGINSGMYHHVFVGRVAIAIAERFAGLIHLGEICVFGHDEDLDLSEDSERRIEKAASEVHPEDRDNPESLLKRFFKQDDPLLKPVFRQLNNSCARRVREKASRMPGRFWEIADEEGHLTYLVDPEFMRHWMQEPGFRI